MSSDFKKFRIKFSSWEFWPRSVLYFPVSLFRFFLSLRAQSSFYFSAANPAMENGGMYGSSKSAVLNKIPLEYRPAMVVVPLSMEWMIALVKIKSMGIRFPFIVKPDLGEDGIGVKRIHHEEEFKTYLENSPCTVIVQEVVEWSEEYSVFYVRLPGEEKGRITSVAKKAFLSVRGNGSSSVEQLMEKDPKAYLQIDRFKKEYPHKLELVPAEGEVKMLEPIATRARGTTYLNANHLINEGMLSTFDAIAKKIDGFYFGRFDVRCRTEEDVITGHQMRILELNGAGAEPSHIYDPESSVFTAWASLFYHSNLLYKVSVANHRKGIPYLTKEEAKPFLEMHKKIEQYRRF